ncbi:hypothetical protein D3C85_1670770 [compost metagenome]
MVGNQRQQALGQEERALELDVEQLFELRFAGFAERRVDADTRVVYQKVQLLAAEYVLQGFA